MKKFTLFLMSLFLTVGAMAQVDFSKFVGCEVSFTNIQQDGTTKYTLYINDDNVLALSTSSVEELGDAAKFFVEKRANNKYSFYNREKQLYMIWRGLNGGYNSDNGVLGTYNATYCDWTIKDGGELASTQTYYIVSKRSNGNDGSLVVKKEGVFDGWGNSKALASNYSNLYDIKIETDRVAYFRLKGYSGGYVDASSIYGGNANATYGQMSIKSDANCNLAGTIFYYDNENRFLNYATGTYVCVGREIAAVGADAAKNTTWDIYCSATKGLFKLYGTYLDGTTTKNVWLHDNSGNRADRCSNEADHANTTHSWTIEEVAALPITISAAGWATFYAPVAVKVADGVTAYAVTINGNWATLTAIEGGVIPANTGVVLQGEANTYNFAITTTDATVDSDLRGSAAATYYTESGTYYALGQVDGVVAFYRDAFNNDRFQNNSHKAYLYVANASDAASFSFRFPGTTAIENVEVENAVKAIFDLTGRKVETISAPGIYIVGGKKVLVK